MRRDQPGSRASAGRPPPAALPPVIGEIDMDAAVARGQAAPLSPTVTFIKHYEGTWWLSAQAGWIPIPPAIGAILDQHAERIRHRHAKTAANHATIHAVISLARQATSPPDLGTAISTKAAMRKRHRGCSRCRVLDRRPARPVLFGAGCGNAGSGRDRG
jgi:hypothetical protein